MTTTDDTPSATEPAIEPAPKPNSFERIIGVLMSPGETFASIARRPDWAVPFFLILIVSLVAGVLVAMHVDFNDLAREAMQMNPKMADIPADRLDSIVRFQAATMKVAAYASPILVALSLLIVAAVLLVSFRLFAGELNFRQAFSVTLYAWVPRLIKGIVAAIIITTHGSLGLFDLQNPVLSNPGFLVDPKSNLLLYTLASSIDLFAIWSLVLMIIGYSIASKLSRGRSAAIVVGWWIVINLVSLIGPAMQMLRK